MHVTKATAEKLKEAGFHQPTASEIRTGQFWYTPKGHLCCVIFNQAQWSFRVAFLDYPNKYAHLVEDAFIFAPNVVDLLNALPVGYQLERTEKGFFAALPSFWGDTMDGYFFESQTYDNPADALAECYLHVNNLKPVET